jgi:hypothetical protein
MSKNKTINVEGSAITIISQKDREFISLTDMATIEQLVVLSNMESINAVLIH